MFDGGAEGPAVGGAAEGRAEVVGLASGAVEVGEVLGLAERDGLEAEGRVITVKREDFDAVADTLDPGDGGSVGEAITPGEGS